jgi:hypothetical protein
MRLKLDDLVNDPKKQTQIFHSLMKVSLAASQRSLQDDLKDIENEEQKGELRVYRPE